MENNFKNSFSILIVSTLLNAEEKGKRSNHFLNEISFSVGTFSLFIFFLSFPSPALPTIVSLCANLCNNTSITQFYKMGHVARGEGCGGSVPVVGGRELVCPLGQTPRDADGRMPIKL